MVFVGIVLDNWLTLIYSQLKDVVFFDFLSHHSYKFDRIRLFLIFL